MKRYIKKFLFLLVFILWSFIFACINYYAPSYEALYIKGLEVKLMDKEGFITNKEGSIAGGVRDVHFIYAEVPETHSVKVFRNEDTRWSFPFYFKFNSADIQAKSASLENTAKPTLVEIKYYGWRIQTLYEFPNVISVEPINSQADLSSPWLEYILYFLALIGFILNIQMVRGLFRSNNSKTENKKSNSVE